MTQSNNIITQIGNKLPFGAKKLIAKKTGLTQKTVVEFFKGDKKPRLATYNLIMDCAVEIIKELKVREDAILDALK